MIHRLVRVAGTFLPLAGVSLGLCLVIGLIYRTSCTVREVMAFQRVSESEIAHALADEAAHMVVSESLGADMFEYVLERNGFECRATMTARESERHLFVIVHGPQRGVYRYTSSVLKGSAPHALGVRLALMQDQSDRLSELAAQMEHTAVAATWLKPEQFPQLHFDGAPSVDHGAYGLRRDDSIALARLASGTDRTDFVFATDSHGLAHLQIPAQGVLVVPGNLWVDDHGPVVRVRIERSLTLVVHGNVYLGQSLRVTGGGRLIVVAMQKGESFVDRDLDGCRSAGEALACADGDPTLEGSGALYFGLPGHGQRSRPLRCDASMVCQGEAYASVFSLRFCGSLALGGGWLQRQSAMELCFSGEELGNVQRVLVPGFALSGAPRPALLQER